MPGDGRTVGRAAEEIPLSELAAELAEGLQLVGRLDALGDDAEVQGLAEGDDRPGEGPVVGPRVLGADELPGDLQDVDREAAEVAERRVAGPEVVDRDPDPEG